MGSSAIRSISEVERDEFLVGAIVSLWDDIPRLLDFTFDDLEHNGAGRLSPRQLVKLRLSAERSIIVGLAISIPALPALVLLFGSGGPAALGWALILSAIPFFVALIPAWRLMMDFYGGRVARAEGLVMLRRQPAPWKAFIGKPPCDYLLVVNGGLARFRVDGRVYRALAPGRYVIYYLTNSGRIMSMAPVSQSSHISLRSPM